MEQAASLPVPLSEACGTELLLSYWAPSLAQLQQRLQQGWWSWGCVSSPPLTWVILKNSKD